MTIELMMKDLKTVSDKTQIIRDTYGCPITGLVLNKDFKNYVATTGGNTPLNVDDFIRILESKTDKTLQIVDEEDWSPIYYFVEKDGRYGTEKGIYMEPVSQMDVPSEIDAFFTYASEEGMDEYNAFPYLGEKGLTLSDFEETDYYEKAVEFSKTHAW